MENNNFTIIQPDDWHIHLREGTITKLVIKDTYTTFGRALVMPNLKKPIFKPDARGVPYPSEQGHPYQPIHVCCRCWGDKIKNKFHSV